MPILRCRDINVYYEIAGAGDPLLFIHGLGSSHRDWEPQVAFFSRHYQVITYDVRGHGKSDKPKGPYSVSQFAADAAELTRFPGSPGILAAADHRPALRSAQVCRDHECPPAS